MVIAEIAYEHLTPKARAQADELLKVGGTAATSDFITAACWADDIRRERRETAPWHFIDIHFREDGKPDSNKPDAENVVWAIRKFAGVLADKSRPEADRADALRFVMHFVGDVHQPLHATSRDTDALPSGDLGGNRFRITPPDSMADLDRPPRNLHALWDLGAGLFPSEGRGFRPLSDAGRETIVDLAHRLERDYPRQSLREARNPDPMKWAMESFSYDVHFVYGLPESSQPSAAYVAQAQKISEERAALAGYRLANVLNSVLK
jgi:hypothetical protein